jgi:HlyD family secretion protein
MSMKIRIPKWAWITLVAVAAGAFFLLRNGGDPGGSADWQIETSAIDRGDIVRSVATSGAVRPLITVEVGSQLSGQVAEIYADFNTLVEKGQILALIDTQTFETRVLQDTANLRVAESNVVVQKAAIDRAKANLRRAQLEYERAAPLREKGTLSASEYDTALASFESAKADLTMAEAQLENAMAALEQRRATLETAQIDLERTRIRSPIDGVVIERAVDQGQTVAASFSAPVLFRIAQDLSEIQIEANVDEADIGNVREGNPVTFSVDAYPDEEFTGEVNQVRLASVEQNNVVTYTVIITARNRRMRLLPGMTAIVEIVTGNSEDVLRVSNDALRFRPPAGSDWESLQAGGSDGPSGGPGGGRMQELARTAEQLGLSDDQVSAIEADMRNMFSGMREQMQAASQQEGGREALREQMRQRMNGVFREHLTAEQYEAYGKIQSARQPMRQGQVWVQDGNGDIRPVSVRLGIGDDQYTQIAGRDIAEGIAVVTKMRAPRP